MIALCEVFERKKSHPAVLMTPLISVLPTRPPESPQIGIQMSPEMIAEYPDLEVALSGGSAVLYVPPQSYFRVNTEGYYVIAIQNGAAFKDVSAILGGVCCAMCVWSLARHTGVHPSSDVWRNGICELGVWGAQRLLIFFLWSVRKLARLLCFLLRFHGSRPCCNYGWG